MSELSRRAHRPAVRLAGTGAPCVSDGLVTDHLQHLLPGMIAPQLARRRARLLATALGMKAKASLGQEAVESAVLRIEPAVLDAELHLGGERVIGDAATALLAAGVLQRCDGGYQFSSSSVAPSPAGELLRWAEVYNRFLAVGEGRVVAMLAFACFIDSVTDIGDSWTISRKALSLRLGYQDRKEVDVGLAALERSGVCRVGATSSGMVIECTPAAVLPGAISAVQSAPSRRVSSPREPFGGAREREDAGDVPLVQNIFGRRFVVPPGAPPVEPPPGYTYVPRVGPDGLEMVLVALSPP